MLAISPPSPQRICAAWSGVAPATQCIVAAHYAAPRGAAIFPREDFASLGALRAMRAPARC